MYEYTLWTYHRTDIDTDDDDDDDTDDDDAGFVVGSARASSVRDRRRRGFDGLDDRWGRR